MLHGHFMFLEQEYTPISLFLQNNTAVRRSTEMKFYFLQCQKPITHTRFVKNLLSYMCQYYLLLRYFSFEPSFKMRWSHAQELFGSQILVTKGGFALQISCIGSSQLTHQALLIVEILQLRAKFQTAMAPCSRII